ncbi:MAG: glutaredoxin [Candidatus Moranbacteria bacterium]|nr:glutaredoxin [Candidatus Moranbacteria bacterium]MDD3964686.1 glutaredoxin [Candidatus Moranbacteria bacterium]
MMNFLGKKILYTLAFWSLVFIPMEVFASETSSVAEGKVLIEMFERQDCAHCQKEKVYLEKLQEQRDDIEVRFLDIETKDGKNLYDRFTEAQQLSKATPITVIGVTVLQGFDTEETTGVRIEKLIKANKGTDLVGIEGLLSGISSDATEKVGEICEGDVCVLPAEEPFFVTLPFTNKTLDVMQYSLPVLSGVLGLIDGFNPCAMWVLVTFLLVLVQMGSRRRMWTVAGLFIIAEAVMYYLILNIWFTTWDFVGLDRFITPIVGIVSIGGGLFFLYEWHKSDGTCQVVNLEGRVKISGRIKKLASEPFTWLTAIGVIALAFSVNVIEFACSIGIPQAFTKIIQMNDLNFLQTQWYMALYILFYMVDDFLVFGLALWGFEKLHLTQAYSKWSNLIGGILMLILGYLLIFHPTVLRFL